MNKTNYKRYRRIGAEIKLLEQDIEDVMNELDNAYRFLDFEDVERLNSCLNFELSQLCRRKAIREEIMLPSFIKIDGALAILEDYRPKGKMPTEDWILNTKMGREYGEGFIFNYLVDEYNHAPQEFTLAIKGSTFYVSNIRWHKNQLLEHDLKMVLKGKVKEVKNGFIVITKHPNFANSLWVLDRETNSTKLFTFREAISYLKEHYYL